MNVEIKRLTPDLAEDYVHYFDITPHDKYVDEHKCYCVCWCSADHRIETDYSTAEKRRALAAQYVKDGTLQGYLAYHEDQVVGWCNANTKSECLYCISWLRFMQSVGDIGIEPGSKVKSVFCFVIAPSMQRKGIATRLLERVCEDAAVDGFDYVEAYPRNKFDNVSSDFMGHVAMYEKCGFSKTAECDDVVVVRRALRETD